MGKSYSIIYKNAYGKHFRLRRINDYSYEFEDGRVITVGKLRKGFEFVKEEKKGLLYITTINGFRVRKKKSDILNNI